MSIFVCENCKTIDNTALTDYWYEKRGAKWCSKCCFGKWHKVFAEEIFDPKKYAYDAEKRFIMRIE